MSLIRSEAGAIWRITITRPEARNALSRTMLLDLVLLLGEAGLDPDARMVLLAGEGPDFCSGADLEDLEAWLEDDELGEHEFYGDPLDEVLRAIAACPVPVLARVHGAALGAGCLLAAACDLSVAADDARLGIPSARLGVGLDSRFVLSLVRAIGPGRAATLLIAGRTISGTTAAGWGLVTEAVPAAELDARVAALAADVAAGAPLSLRAAKAAIRLGESPPADLDDPRILAVEATIANAMASEDLREGIRAFREDRPPEFRGR